MPDRSISQTMVLIAYMQVSMQGFHLAGLISRRVADLLASKLARKLVCGVYCCVAVLSYCL